MILEVHPKRIQAEDNFFRRWIVFKDDTYPTLAVLPFQVEYRL